jgi:CheY-like chemotaxis protein
MSHEIRTPMTAILGFAESLQESTLSESERSEAVDTILRNGKHLLQLINDILDLSKIEAGKLETEHVACSPLQLIEDVRSLMSVRAAAKALRFELRVDGKLPKQVLSDPTRLRQVLVNLVGNSIKFTELGHVTLHARYHRQADAARLEFAVEDSGIGMSEEQLAGLFRAFQQADSSMSRRFGGTGLGLHISKRLAELLGGDIEAESVLGQGSLFSFWINCPLYEDEELEAPQREPVLPSAHKRLSSSSAKASRLTGKVLLAEDGPDNQRLIGHLVRKTGAELVIVDNGEKAVQATREASENGEPFDLVLMDMQMPVLDGYAATRELRLLGFETPISALTAHAMAGDRERCLDAGCSDYLTKPVDRKSLRALLERYLAAQQATR